MRTEITVLADGRQTDVEVAAPATAPTSQVLAAIGRAVDLPAELLLAGVPADERIGDGRLGRGTVIGPGTTPLPDGRGALYEIHVVGGSSAGTCLPIRGTKLVIGRDPSCDLVLTDTDVSRRHAAIDVEAGLVLRDLRSTNGTFVDGTRVDSVGVPLALGATVQVGGCSLVVVTPDQQPAAVGAFCDGRRSVRRAPRSGPRPGEVIDLPPSSDPRSGAPTHQWSAVAIPLVVGIALAWWQDSPQFLFFALLAPLTVVGTALGNLVGRRRRLRAARASATDRRRAIDDGLAAEARDRRARSPDPASAMRTAHLPSDRLWCRRPDDADGLHVRLGLGDVASGLRVREGSTTRPAGVLRRVPVEADLRRGALGMGGPARVVDATARWIVAQLAVTHSPAEVRFAFVLGEDRVPAWAWARWLPHVYAVGVGSGAITVLDDLRASCERRGSPRAGGGAPPQPWLVLIVDRSGDHVGHPALATILDSGPARGITALCVDTDAGRVPPGCASIAKVADEAGNRLVLADADSTGRASGLCADGVSRSWAERLARHVAPFTDPSGESAALPDACGLFDTVELPAPEPGGVEERWSRPSPGAVFCLGARATGAATFDLSRDGPHALVAGTTGSGKSELLRTMIASLAVNHSPEDLTFLLVDYKGGAAFGNCTDLPHVSALVTDLDPYLTERALRSLTAELRRREQLLASLGAMDLDAYRAERSAAPLSRIVIVIDEFATLVEEHPTFVSGLVGVARRGRSLGVHLVLATQRPGHAVSPEIRANTSLRICLRVNDAAESTDVLDSVVAATLDRATPGRAYVRSSTGLECVQTAHASGTSTATGTIRVRVLDPWPRRPPDPTERGPSDLHVLVAAIGEAARRSGRRRAPAVWQPPLPRTLSRASLGPTPGASVIRFGVVDLPDQLRVDGLEVDLGRGESLLVVGSRGSGRTVALTSVARGAADQLSPDALALYVVDPVGDLLETLGAVPHLATALGPGDLDLLPRLVTRIHGRAGAGGFRSLLLVDGWDRVATVLGDAEAARCWDALLALVRAGGNDLSVIVSGSRSLLLPGTSSAFSGVIVLRPTDRSDVALLGPPHLPTADAGPPGRGIRASDGAAVQVAAPEIEPPAVHGPHQLESRAVAAGRIVVRSLPPVVALAALPTRRDRFVLGLAGDDAGPLTVDLHSGSRRFLVAGPPRSGRTTTLVLLARQAVRDALPTIVVASDRSRLAAVASALGIDRLSPDDSDPGPPPAIPTLALVDDCEELADRPLGDPLLEWVRCTSAPLIAVVAGSTDAIAAGYRGLAAEVRRSRCGLLLQPGPADGDLLGTRLPRRVERSRPGRGFVVGDPAWNPVFGAGDALPIQVANS